MKVIKDVEKNNLIALCALKVDKPFIELNKSEWL